ncbi:hypothetical protein C8R45DRAFT_92899 [Mycena sanguinolenta]|nr:hypothetical protein C8R45DRAFT_92899 [Mycena sanguinolenta]
MLETPARHCAACTRLESTTIHGWTIPSASVSFPLLLVATTCAYRRTSRLAVPSLQLPLPTPSAHFLLTSLITRPSHQPPHPRPRAVLNGSPSTHTGVHLSHHPSSVALSLAVPDTGSPNTCLSLPMQQFTAPFHGSQLHGRHVQGHDDGDDETCAYDMVCLFGPFSPPSRPLLCYHVAATCRYRCRRLHNCLVGHLHRAHVCMRYFRQRTPPSRATPLRKLTAEGSLRRLHS